MLSGAGNGRLRWKASGRLQTIVTPGVDNTTRDHGRQSGYDPGWRISSKTTPGHGWTKTAQHAISSRLALLDDPLTKAHNKDTCCDSA